MSQDPRVRLAISQWPEDARREAVSTFCAEHGIPRKSFYELRKRTKVDAPAAVLEPRSRRRTSSPTRLTEEVKTQAVQVRAALEASGLDHGPISLHDKRKAMGMDVVPSVASLARSSSLGMATVRPSGTERLLAARRCRARVDRWPQVRDLPAHRRPLSLRRRIPCRGGETVMDAIRVVDKANAAHGVPQRLLSDNGVPLNPSRRGLLGQLVDHVWRLGVEAITGTPYKPTTQGITDGDKLTITDLQGELLAEHTRPAPGIHYVGNGRRPGPRPKNSRPSPMS
jgi:putative transposase